MAACYNIVLNLFHDVDVLRPTSNVSETISSCLIAKMIHDDIGNGFSFSNPTTFLFKLAPLACNKKWAYSCFQLLSCASLLMNGNVILEDSLPRIFKNNRHFHFRNPLLQQNLSDSPSPSSICTSGEGNSSPSVFNTSNTFTYRKPYSTFFSFSALSSDSLVSFSFFFPINGVSTLIALAPF